MAIKIQNSTIIDDSRNIVNAGVTTVTSVSIGNTQVISSARQLQNIASLDATTTATIESAIANAPNTFTDLNVTGISTLEVTSTTNLTAQQLNVSGVSTIGNFGIAPVGSGATVGGIGITYYGDGSNLTGTILNTVQNIDNNQIYYPLLSPTISGTISSISVSSDSIVFNPGTNSLGIGSTQPTARLDVVGDAKVSGVLTAANILPPTDNTGVVGNTAFTWSNGQFTNLTINDTLTVRSAIDLADSDILRFGTSDDVQLFYNGTTNDLNIELESAANQIAITDNGTYKVVIKKDGSVGIGSTIPTSKLDVVGDGRFAGVVTATTFFGALTGTATTASSVTANSVTLGSDTTGDYVQTISGTANQITVTSGTGEGSTPTLSIPNQFTAPQDVTVTRDLQVNRNLNVTGNITIGGTSATIFSQSLTISDPDIVLGFRTDGSGNDVSNDNTANHGGVALASTEGNPLVQLFIAGIETNPATYKKIMWFKSGTFSGLGTDAWLSNYAVGIGSTQFPSGTRLAAGSVQFTQNDLAVVRNINASGVITAITFSGTLSGYASTAGIATYSTNAGIATYSTNAGIATYATSAGIATYASNAGIATYASNAGIATYASNAGVATYATSAGIATYATSSGIATYATSAGIATYATSSGIATYATNAGIATYATSAGIATYASNAGVATYATSAGIATYATSSGIATYATSAGIATYATNAGIATNVKGGSGGTLIYQSATDTTAFISNGTSGQILQSNGGTSAPSWVNAAPSNAITGLTIRDEGTVVGGANSVSTLNFVGAIVSAASTAGIATITFLDYVSNAGVATYATNAGISTNLKGGLVGNIPYQSAANTTAFLTNGSSGTILQSNGVGNTPTWVTPAPAGAITGLTIRDEGTIVGSASSVSTINFVGNIVSVASTAGIATITFLDYVSNAGVATYATRAGVATSVIGGIGSITQLQVTGVSTFTNGPVFIGAATSTGTALQRLQVTDGAYVSGSVGIGTTNPQDKLTVLGRVQIQQDSGSNNRLVLRGQPSSLYRWNVDNYGSANEFRIFREDDATTLNGATLVSISTIGTLTATKFSGDGSLLTNLPTASSQWVTTSVGVHTLSNVGIGTTNPTSKLTVSGNASITGILTADQVYTSNNGTGQNIRIGDDLWVGDINVSDTARFSGAFDSTKAFIVFGSSDAVALGRTGTGPLYYGGNFTAAGIITASSFSGNASSATYATTAGVATALQNSRTFEITGDIVASPISFDGTGNVSLAATIQPNSVALGGDTTGDYVQSITGTANQITVTSGTGEGSTPTLSVPNQFTAPQDVTVTRDLQVNRNLNVTGNITIGGTSATIFSQSLNIFDPDIVLGFRTDGSGNDVSNDNTANHGGVAIASTEGSPLVQLFIAGIETNPATYKKIMWFKAGTFTGLGTDAWLSNYAVGIGSTQFPTGTRLAAGSVQFTENDLAVVRNINASGITTTNNLNVTGVGTFLSSGLKIRNPANTFGYTITGGAIAADRILNLPIITATDTVATLGLSQTFSASQTFSSNLTVNGSITFNTTGSNINVGTSQTAPTLILGGTAQTGTMTLGQSTVSQITNIQAGVSLASTTKTINFGTGGASGSFTQINIGPTAGVGTITINSGTNLGIGSATPTSKLDVVGDVKVTGVVTATTFIGALTGTATTAGIATYATSSGIATYATNSGIATYATNSGIATYATNAGIATYATSSGIATYATNAGVATYATTAGVSTSAIGGIGSITQLQVTGISTFTNGPVLIGTGTLTGTASQPLQVTGGAYVSGSVGIGTTNPTSKLDVRGVINVGGAVSITAETDSGYNDVIYFNPLNESRVSIGINTTLNWSSVSGIPDVAFVADKTIFGYPKIAIANPTQTSPFYELRAAYSNVSAPYGYVRQDIDNGSYAIALDNAATAFSVGDRTSLDSTRASNFSAANEAFVVILNGSTSLFHSKSKKFETSGVGVTVYGNLNVGTGGTVITTTATGLVGIGTTNPTTTLHVQGSARITGITSIRDVTIDKSIVSPNATVPVAIIGVTTSGISTETNIDVVLLAKGTGATLAQIPDGTATGGDKRGQYATDWQKQRIGSSRVASGNYSTIGGGYTNTASGLRSTVAGGNDNLASGQDSAVCGGNDNITSSNYSFIGGGQVNRAQTNTHATVCGGFTNTASGQYSFIGGGAGNTSSGLYSSVLSGANNTASGVYANIAGGRIGTADSDYSFIGGGNRGTTRGIVGYVVFPASNIPITDTAGVTQSALLLLGRQTTDATATVLCSNSGVAANTTNQVTLPNNSAYFFKGSVIAGVTGAGNTKAWEFRGAIKRGANAAATSIVGSVIKDVIASDAGASTWDITITADTTNGAIAVTVTGAASTTIRWVCKIETTEMTY